MTGESIESIWSDAFANQKAARLMGKRKKFRKGGKIVVGFTQAWFQSHDGRIYNLTKPELLRYMPDAIIHPKYKALKNAPSL